MNFKKLENNLLDMIQEQQVKIGYMSGVTRFYYPLQSLNRLLGTELTEEEMQHAMEEFSDHACDRLGKVKASSKNERFCITLPPQASDYVHENRKPSEFLVRFINTVARHGCTLDEVMNVFHSYSKHVHMEKTTGTGFDYLVYFEDGIPDDYRYCLSLEGEHMIYLLEAGAFGVVIPLILLAIGVVNVLYPSLICICVSFLMLVWLFLFKRKDMVREMQKKFRV